MAFEYCERFGIDRDAIAQRLVLAGLARPASATLGETLQRAVVQPNLDSIIDDFLGALRRTGHFESFVESRSEDGRLEAALRGYLLDLGVAYDGQPYFEKRLRVGAVHQRLGIPQSVYHGALRKLQSILIRRIPAAVRSDPPHFESLVDFILKITSLDLSLAVESYCANRICGLENSLRDERGESARLRQLAHTDWLTTLHNHSFCRHLLATALAAAKKSGTPLCAVMADLDHFKQINDRYGHLVGDEVLRIAASRMQSAARAGTEIGRYGGEEFLMVLPDADLATAREVAERVRQRVNGDAIHSDKARISVSISLGIAQARRDDDVNSLIERADAALYAAKLAGRDCVRTESKKWRSRADVAGWQPETA